MLLRSRYKNWGTTRDERHAHLTGDDLVDDPADQVTRAVTIAASAAEVWRWLVQIGKGRGGMYSYDWLENAIGLDIHSSDEIRDEWQHLVPGDRIVLVPAGWPGMKAGYSLPVAQVECGRAIVLRQAPPEHPWNAVWSFAISPQGPDRCRLISRSRTKRIAGVLGTLQWVATEMMDPITMVMTRKMLLGIKERAERSSALAG